MWDFITDENNMLYWINSKLLIKREVMANEEPSNIIGGREIILPTEMKVSTRYFLNKFESTSETLGRILLEANLTSGKK